MRIVLPLLPSSELCRNFPFRKDKLIEWFAGACCQLALPQPLWQGIRVAKIPNGPAGTYFEIRWNVEVCTGFVTVKTSDAVRI